MYEKSLYIHPNNFQRILYTPLNIGYCMALECSSRIQIMNYRSDEPWERENKSYFPLAALFIPSQAKGPYFHPLGKWSSVCKNISWFGFIVSNLYKWKKKHKSGSVLLACHNWTVFTRGWNNTFQLQHSDSLFILTVLSLFLWAKYNNKKKTVCFCFMP